MTRIRPEHQRYEAYAGFVTTPRYFDDSPQQFLQVAPQGTGVLQRVNHIADYAYELDERATNFGVLEESAVCLGLSHCEVIGQVGTNWVHCNGTSPQEIQGICDEISSKAGAPFLMAGQMLVDGLQAIGAETITVANAYYRPDWSAGINAYLEAAGFRILWAGDLIDQGLVADHEEKLRIEAATLWDYPNHLMAAARYERCARPWLSTVHPDNLGGVLEMNKILVLWAVPRSTSTAFEWLMRMREDMDCFHEPFGEVWYQGEDPLWPRLTEDSVRTPGLTFASVWADLRAAAERGPVFVKEFPLAVETLWTDDFLSHFTHSFLIRDPAKTVTSMFKHWPDFIVKETGFAEQRELFDRLTDAAGAPPPVIDSDDLLANPVGVVETWCEAVGIPFVADALSWAPGARDEVSWWDGGSFHQTLRDSDGLKPQPGSSVDLGDAPERVREVYEILKPHYEHLRRFRLTVQQAQ